MQKLSPLSIQLKTDIIKVGLVFSISNFFINKTYQANIWNAKKIPSCANLALEQFFFRSRSKQFW